jgi:hypothetical protein
MKEDNALDLGKRTLLKTWQQQHALQAHLG